ncbi:hypothetical protein ACIB24_16305 [Spongisporangium articulatum]|uniref:FG-GAP repeat protein n=1 Tax=Spongisporangium articulatum TaxID=3362603 RepID=A0ABW8AQI7_9ACTN
MRRGLIAAVVLAVAALGSTEAPVLAADGDDPAPATGLARAIVVGSPFGGGSDGRVDVFRPDGTSELLTTNSLGFTTGRAGTEFGDAVAVGDLDSDGLDDLVVGAWFANNYGGRTWILFNSPTGYAAGKHVELTPNRIGGDYFGAAVAITSRSGGRKDVWVGAPGRTVSGVPAAGVVWRFTVSSSGSVGTPKAVSQNTSGVPGSAEPGDWFGSVLAPASEGVVVGVPDEAIGKHTDAGMVEWIWQGGRGLEGIGLSQDSPGVPGVAETGDMFGWSVSAGGEVVGAPWEDVGSTKDAGGVQTFRISGTGESRAVAAGPALSQNSAGVPGTAEKGDLFGYAVTTGVFECPGVRSMAVGSPYETLGGSWAYGGTVAVTTLPGEQGTCPTRSLAQEAGLPGSIGAGNEQTGRSLGTVARADVAGTDQLLIGAPGEQMGNANEAGIVIGWTPGASGFAFGRIGLDGEFDHFGSVL